MPAMCKPGFYRLGSVDVELKEGNRVVLRTENRLAGSALRFDEAIGNAVRMGAISLRDALSMATVNPARVCRIAGRQRGLTPGERADFIRFTMGRRASSPSSHRNSRRRETVYSRTKRFNAATCSADCAQVIRHLFRRSRKIKAEIN